MSHMAIISGCSTHHTDGAEHEPEGDSGSNPALGQGVVAAMIVEHMTTLQLNGN